MSFTKQFNPPPDYPEGETKGHFPTPSIHEEQASLAATLGIASIGMVEIITHDISQMIEKEQRHSLDGYILCLSRIISKEIAWKCITRAFVIKGEPVPTKYQLIYEKHQIDESSPKTMQVGT